jgi:hypothetical protein
LFFAILFWAYSFLGGMMKGGKKPWPNLDDLHAVISVEVMTKDRNKLPLSTFLDSWNSKLKNGWLRHVVATNASQVLPKRMTSKEKQICGLIGFLVAKAHMKKWTGALGQAFGCGVHQVRACHKEHCNSLMGIIGCVSGDNKSSPEHKMKRVRDSATPQMTTESTTVVNIEFPSFTLDAVMKPTPQVSVSSPMTTSTTGTPMSLSGESAASAELTATLMPPSSSPIGKKKRQREQSTPFSSPSLLEKASNAASLLTPSCKVLFSDDTGEHLSPARDSCRAQAQSQSILSRVHGNVEASVLRTVQKAKRAYRIILDFAKPRRLNKTALEASRTRIMKKKGTQVLEALNAVCGPDEDATTKKAVLEFLVKRFGGIIQWKEYVLSVDQIIAIREWAKGIVSTNCLVSIFDAIAKLLDLKNFAPTQLKQKIGAREREGLPAEHTLIELKVTKEKTEPCVFYYIPNVPLLLENFIRESIVNNNQEDSIEFSNYENKHVFIEGADRGGGDLMMMLRYANRKKGNNGRHSVPIGVAEGATEDYDNLQKTIYSEERKEIIQFLLSQQAHILEISGQRNDEQDKIDVRCLSVGFVQPTDAHGRPLFLPKALDVQAIVGDDIVLQDSAELTGYTSATERRMIDKLPLTANMVQQRENGRFDLEIMVQMVRLAETDAEEPGGYVGCVLTTTAANGEVLFSFAFDKAMNCRRASFEANCKHVVCFPAEDGKMATCLYGLSTAGVKYPCLRCLYTLGCPLFPQWMYDEYPLLFEEPPTCHDFALRNCEHSRAESFRLFEKLTGKDRGFSIATTTQIPVDIRDQTKSVSKKPLLDVDLDAHSGDPMHLTQGYMTHLTQETCKLLVDIIGGVGWAERKREEAIQILHLESVESAEFLRCRRRHTSLHAKVKKLLKQMLEARTDAADDLDAEEHDAYAHLVTIENIESKMEDAIAARDEFDSNSGYMVMTAKIRGAKELLKVVNEVDESGKKKKLDQAEFIFLQAIRTHAGYFNKQHGTMELTNGLGIMALENRADIAEALRTAYSANPARNAAVRVVADWWEELAGYLYEISTMAKSQEKMDGQRFYTFKENVVKYAILWREKVTWKSPVFWKMHTLECALINFITVTGMCGRCSSEGFENKHFIVALHKELLAKMAKTTQRVQKLSQRQQLYTDPHISEITQELQEKTDARSTGKRGCYNTNGRKRNAEEVSIHVDEGEANDGYFKTATRGLMREDLREFYNFYERNKVPIEWHEAFEQNEQLGNGSKFVSAYNH